MEISTLADQLHPALQLLAACPAVFARRGHVAESWRRRNGKTFGPYYRLCYRDGQRQRSIYLGRAGELVEQVRQQLASIQQPRMQRLALQRFQRQIRASLRAEKQRISSLLKPYGLRLKGFELRGMRFSPLHRSLPRWRPTMPRFSAIRRPVLHPNRDPPPVRLAKFLDARDGPRVFTAN